MVMEGPAEPKSIQTGRKRRMTVTIPSACFFILISCCKTVQCFWMACKMSFKNATLSNPTTKGDVMLLFYCYPAVATAVVVVVAKRDIDWLHPDEPGNRKTVGKNSRLFFGADDDQETPNPLLPFPLPGNNGMTSIRSICRSAETFELSS